MYSKKVMEMFKNPKNVGEIKNPDGFGEVGNPSCLIPNSMIEANPSLKSISGIKKNNHVLSHDGKYNKVSKPFKRKYSGEIINVKNRLGTTVLTPEHEVFSVILPKKHGSLYLKNKKKVEPAWHHAFELKKGDLVLYPILKEAVDVRKIAVDTQKKKYDFKSKKIPSSIDLSGDFLRLCGYYLAEGHLREKTTKTCISFTFGISEDDYADDTVGIVRKIFGIEAKKITEEKRNVIKVEVNNVFIVRLFKSLFDNGAANKHIPQFMMLLSPEKQKNLIKGLWLGDGFVNTKIPRAGYATISYVLWQQIKTLLLRQKIIPSLYVEKEKKVRGVNHRKSYRIHVGGRESIKRLSSILDVPVNTGKKESNDSWIDDNFAYVPVTSISKKRYDGFVHNLSVENAKSFVTDSLAVHNCGDVMAIYIKVGKDKKNPDKKVITEIKFKTFGCAAAIATSSMVTELAKGKTLEEAERITKGDVAEELDGLPPIKMHCSNLAADALREAIKDYRSKKKN